MVLTAWTGGCLGDDTETPGVEIGVLRFETISNPFERAGTTYHCAQACWEATARVSNHEFDQVVLNLDRWGVEWAGGEVDRILEVEGTTVMARGGSFVLGFRFGQPSGTEGDPVAMLLYDSTWDEAGASLLARGGF